MNTERKYPFYEVIYSIVHTSRVRHPRRGRLVAGLIILILLCAATSLISCGNRYDESKKKRAALARNGRGDIVIAVVWPRSVTGLFFPEGVDLAVQEVNEKGGVLGRGLRARYFRDVDKAGDTFDAEKIARSAEIVAVLGHFHSDSTLSALITYEYHGLLLLIGAATNPLLLEQGFDYVFRPIPNDHALAVSLARYAHRTGYKTMAIIDNNTLYGNGLADNFYEEATDQGLEIIIHRGYLPWQDDFRPLIAQIDKLKFDAIFVAGVLPEAARFVKQLRQMGVEAPIISGDGLDSEDLITIAGKAAEGLVVPETYRPRPSNPAYQNFVKAFREKFQHDPDHYAALGYDLTHLLATVMSRNDSAVPLVVASALRHMQDWQGLIGSYSFSEDGELSARKIYFKQVQNGQFVDIKE